MHGLHDGTVVGTNNSAIVQHDSGACRTMCSQQPIQDPIAPLANGSAGIEVLHSNILSEGIFRSMLPS